MFKTTESLKQYIMNKTFFSGILVLLVMFPFLGVFASGDFVAGKLCA